MARNSNHNYISSKERERRSNPCVSDSAKIALNIIIMVSNYTEPTHVHSLHNIKEDIEVHMRGVVYPLYCMTQVLFSWVVKILHSITKCNFFYVLYRCSPKSRMSDFYLAMEDRSMCVVSRVNIVVPYTLNGHYAHNALFNFIFYTVITRSLILH